MEVTTTMMMKLLDASLFAQQRNDPDIAILNIEALNQKLPPKFRVNLDAYKPKEPNKATHDKIYLRSSLDHPKRVWQYYSVALKAVMEAVAKYSYAMRAQYMSV